MKRIGIDIDGVIANTQPVIIEFLNKYYGKNYALPDFINFDPKKMYGIDSKQLDDFIMERELDIIKVAVPRDGAVAAINMLKRDYSIHLISARTTIHLPHTVSWLKKYNIGYDNLIHLGHHDKRCSCKDEGVSLFIEDNKKNAIQISSCGIPVYLFDATYNQGELPDLVHRVFSWQEILGLIKNTV